MTPKAGETSSRTVAVEGTTRYRYIGIHPDNLHSGRPLGMGDFVDLTEDQANESTNKQLIDSGLLVKAD